MRAPDPSRPPEGQPVELRLAAILQGPQHLPVESIRGELWSAIERIVTLQHHGEPRELETFLSDLHDDILFGRKPRTNRES